MRPTAISRHLPTLKAKLMARVGEEFPLECPGCGGDIRLIAFITDPGPIRKILAPVLLHTEWRTARTTARLAGPWPADRLGRARAGPRRPGNLSGVARRAARDRHPQPLTAFHATVRTAREKSGFKAGLRQREKPGLERGQEAPRHLHDRTASSPASPGCCSSWSSLIGRRLPKCHWPTYPSKPATVILLEHYGGGGGGLICPRHGTDDFAFRPVGVASKTAIPPRIESTRMSQNRVGIVIR
jgi:hypothetical protein